MHKQVELSTQGLNITFWSYILKIFFFKDKYNYNIF